MLKVAIFYKRLAKRLAERISEMNQRTDLSLHDRIRLAKAGDQQAFEELLEKYSPLIDTLTASFANSSHAVTDEREDFRQEACIAFYNAVNRYDLTTVSIEFGAYAKCCIKNRLISCLRKKRSDVPIESGSEFSPTETQDPAQMIVEEENYSLLHHRIRSLLSPYENRVWWLYYTGRTAREIASKLNKEERSVQNAIYRIRQKLRKEIPNP